ncbi:MAG TPA: hypothetical protein VHN80_28145, partial [Kineosporiaceae bacterium]|nr:hypothetical protein [Kineosporiaceae bacterium]
KGLIQVQEQQPDRAEPQEFGFRHILIQQAAYRAILKSARAQLHESVADWMETGVGERSSQWIEVIGHHLEQAAHYRRELQQEAQSAELGRRATTYLRRAGRAALALGDAAAAVSAFERARGLLTASDPDRAPILTGLGAALFEAGRLSEAKDALDTAQQVAAAQGQDGFAAHAKVQALLLDLHLDPGAATAKVEQSVPMLRATFTRDGDELGLCRTWQLEAAVRWARARSADAEQAWERAAASARAADDQRHLTRSLRWLASAALWGPTPAGVGITRCESYLQEIGSTPTGRAVIFLHTAGLYAMSDRLVTARELLERGAAILQDVGSNLPMAVAEPAAFVAMLTDDAPAAERYLRSAYDRLRDIGEQADLSTTAALLARAIAVQGRARHDEADSLVAISWAAGGGQDLSAMIIGNCVRARVLAARGPFGDAVGLAEDAVALAAKTDFVHQHGDTLLDLGHVLAASDRHDDARKAILAARTLYDGKGSVLGVRACDRLLAPDGSR